MYSTTTNVYYSDKEDNTYLQIEIEGDYGTMYQIYSKGDVFESEIVTNLWLCEDGIEYDDKLETWQLEFLKSIFSNAKKI